MTDVETKTREDLQAFRVRAREWLEANAEPRRRGDERVRERRLQMGSEEEREALARARDFQRRLAEAGFAGITWPTGYGGAGLTPAHQSAWNLEASGFVIPVGFFGIGLGMCAPTILAHGTEDQKERYVPKLVSGEEIWSQLFSEPGAGSDVAGLQMRAVREGDEWILNGQKVWTTGAHYSDYGCVIVRTDPDLPKHQGLTMFIVDLKATGVTVKPLVQITGDASFNEVFFDDVRVPADGGVLGEVNDGWRVAITMLMNERMAIGGGSIAGGGAGDRGVLRLLTDNAVDAAERDLILDLYVQQRVLGQLRRRMATEAKGGTPGPEFSMLKLLGARQGQRASEIAMGARGPASVAWDDPDGDRAGQMLLGSRSATIAGGTDEIMLNILGERVLGLPKDPPVDRDIPFRDIKVGTVRA